MSTTIVLVRHGETDWNREHRFQGHADTRLNEEGRRQAQALAELLGGEHFVAAYSSPLQRAFETAEILAAPLGLDVATTDALMEVDVGSWSGLTTAEVAERFPEGFRRWSAFGHGWDDGESYEELGLRVLSGLHEIAAAHRGARVLVVTHGGPIRSAVAAARGFPFESARSEIGVVGNCATLSIVVRGGVVEAVDRPPRGGLHR